MNKKNALLLLVLILIVGAVIYQVSAQQGKQEQEADQQATTTPTATPTQTQTTGSASTASPSASATAYSFVNSKKAAHFVRSSPVHASTIATLPEKVQIVSNFDVTSKSTISIKKEGKEYGSAATAVVGDSLILERSISDPTPGGLYNVTYSACWPDGSCHDGSFQFAVQQ